MKYLTIFLLLAISAFARLGETPDEISARVGRNTLESKHYIPVQGKMVPLGRTLFFQKEEWGIQCDLIDQKCGRITYTKKGDWTEAQKQDLLVSNAQTAKWIEAKDSNKMIRKWNRSDGGFAEWKFTGEMIITSYSYVLAKNVLEKSLNLRSKELPGL